MILRRGVNSGVSKSKICFDLCLADSPPYATLMKKLMIIAEGGRLLITNLMYVAEKTAIE